MLASSVFAAGMHVTVKYVALEIHPFEIFFLRQSIALVLLAPIFLNIGFAALKTERLGMHFMRGVFMTAGGMAWFWAISLVPLAKVTALNLSAVLFTVLAAIIFLKEASEWKRWAALIFGFIGVIVIVRPGYEIISFGVILVIVTRLFPAGARVLSKVLSRTERTPTIVVYGAVAMSVLSFIPAMMVWITPNLEQFFYIILVSIGGTLSQLSMVTAYKVGDIGAVEPFHFVRLIWAALFGFILFGEIPSIWVWIGASMIIAAVTYLAQGEARKKNPEAEQPGATTT
ncbi:MAG: DMT family transporter [Rhodospirillaceae bacterium]|nr:DMT family transporter [Rhodospirillaceae bacterium]MBT4589203.1 DMT family transporter [Rhodospirillaceae bacterium]MBT4938141.1 DMT family transporter [Rhodospirillaceae bacterium]MBT5941766.1 DMT family transporter [Rhodospirillaceae bacterium]MBT7267676.1 DMT family transporter [Rhodospirillaceae bacterium]